MCKFLVASDVVFLSFTNVMCWLANEFRDLSNTINFEGIFHEFWVGTHKCINESLS